MKNLGKKERDEFDKGWQNAFEDASVEPSPDLWGKIDGELANRESVTYKKRLVFYKYVAAASILLLFSTGLLSYYFIQKAGVPAEGRLAMEDTARNNGGNVDSPAVQEENMTGLGNGQENGIAQINPQDDGRAQEKPDGPKETGALVAEAEDETFTDTTTGNDGGEQGDPSLNQQNNKAIALEYNDLQAGQEDKRILKEISQEAIANSLASQDETDIGQYRNDNLKLLSKIDGKIAGSGLAALSPLAPKKLKPGETSWEAYHMYLVPTFTNEEKPLEKDEKMTLFAGLNFTPGYFDPNIKATASSIQPMGYLNDAVQSASFNNTSTRENSMTSGSSYAFGFDVGLKLKERWVVESGLQYFVNNSGATANAFVEDQSQNRKAFYVTTAETQDYSRSINISSPIPLNNSFQFASVPLKLGYMVLDKKLSITVSSGVSSEFFLRNEVSEENNRQASVTIRPGGDSPYRSVYFNGLASARVSYHFSDNYSFSLEPSYRMAISSFAKTSSRFTSAPQSLGIAAGLKFYFR